MEASENGAGGVYGRIGELAACLGLKAGAEGIAALAATLASSLGLDPALEMAVGRVPDQGLAATLG